MFKKAIVRISLVLLVVVSGIGSVFAFAPAKPEALRLSVDSSSYFYTRVASSEAQAYKLDVPAGVTRFVKVEAARPVNVKITTADGRVFSRQDQRIFFIELSNSGETTIEINAVYDIGVYTISVLGK